MSTETAGPHSRPRAGEDRHRPVPASAPLLAFEGVTFRYPGSSADDPPALADMTLAVRPGDRVGLVGPNGGGKTTAVKLALGMLHPTVGSVSVCGSPARWGGHVPDVGCIGNPSRNDGESGLPPDLTVGRLLDAHRELFRRSGRDDLDAGLLARLGLDKREWRRKRVSQLSDGWRQRVLAYLALAKRPRLLIADEATAGLDREHRPAVLTAVADVLAETGMAVVWVTHAYSELLALRTGTVVRVERGRPESIPVTAWRCELAIDGGEPQRLCLTPDTLFDLFAEHALGDRTRTIRMTLDRPHASEGGSR